MLELVTPRARQVLTPRTSFAQTWQRSTRRCCIPNVTALSLPVSEKKIKFSFFVPMFKLLTHGAGPDLTPGHHMNKLGRGLLGDATY